MKKHQRKPIVQSLAVLLLTMHAGSNLAVARNSIDTTAITPYGYTPAPEDMVSTFELPTGNFSVDTHNKEMVRDFYQTIFKQTALIDTNWSGSAPCNADDTSGDFKQAALTRINFFRAMAGVSSNVILDNNFDTEAQNLALHISYPAATCLANSTTALTDDSSLRIVTSKGVTGANAITSFMDDFGSGNEDMLTRMFVLDPSMTAVGTGNVGNTVGASIFWSDTPTDVNSSSLRDGFVSWPSPGYSPASLIFERWSFFSPDIDFSDEGITVTMQDAANSHADISLEILHRENGLISWLPTMPQEPTRLVGNESTDWIVSIQDSTGQDLITPYHVKAFNPESVSTTITQNSLNNTNLRNLQSRLVTAPMPTLSAETSSSRISSTQGNSLMFASGISSAGNRSYHLSNPNGQTETLTILTELQVAENASFEFDSRIAFAGQNQKASVEAFDTVSKTWNNILPLLDGTANSPTVETRFNHQTIDLSAYAGQSIKIRFNYQFDQGVFSFATVNSGWYIDSITFTNVNATFERAGLDINGDDNAGDALTDGLAIIRYLFSPNSFSAQDICPGLTDADCIAAIRAQIQALSSQLDIDGNGVNDALTDGILLMRYFFGIRGDALIQNAVATDCSRCTSIDIENHIAGIQ